MWKLNSNMRLNFNFHRKNMNNRAPCSIKNTRSLSVKSWIEKQKKEFEELFLFRVLAYPFKNYYFRHFVRAFQISTLSFAIYNLGYHDAAMTSLENPEKFRKSRLEIVLNSMGSNQYQIGKGVPKHQQERVENITSKLIKTANEYFLDQIGLAQKEKNRVVTKIWINRLSQISGDWDVVLIKSKKSNAFVCGTCPRTIFVLTGIFENENPTDDELAMILGHEISHVILGHNYVSINMQFGLIVTQLFFTMLVDATGFWSYLYDKALNRFRTMLLARYSQNQETEADELGLLLTMGSCYNGSKGANILNKINCHDHEPNGSVLSFLFKPLISSHPSSASRYEKLIKLAELYKNKDLIKNKCSYLGYAFNKVNIDRY